MMKFHQHRYLKSLCSLCSHNYNVFMEEYCENNLVETIEIKSCNISIYVENYDSWHNIVVNGLV